MSKTATKVTKKTPVEKLLKLRTKITGLASLDEAATFDIAVKLYWIALYLRDDVDDWQTFCEHVDWVAASSKPQPRAESRKKALHFAIRFAVGFKDKANGNRVRKLQDLLSAAWEKGTKKAEIEAHVKNVQDAKRLKASESRAKRRAAEARSIKLLPSDASRLLMENIGDYELKGKFKISGVGSRRMSLQIKSLSKKSLTKLELVKPVTAKPAGK
ncbi:hypothetical protein [Agrobacterium genomosp. 13]|uniref:Uncharacterized protein n=1 Tax=Agrobacterium genomosp. 13 str. CFBP 6927 TaxID=1183428 RepID=A0ABM9VE27_9HYPH|nr:hypothetical protein [Agrobacterium genomosp. 13]CUX24117.1 hypothetical protein AGR13a_Cc240024 [Agrobacterium genomosp. 13 str. CFBP 6927]